jgi:hypothetical protein
MIKNLIIIALCIVIFVKYTVERHTLSPQFTLESGEKINVSEYDNCYRIEIDYSTDTPIIKLLDIQGANVRIVADLSNDSLLKRTITLDNE